MTSNVLNQLQELQKQSNRHLNPVIMSYLKDQSNPRALVKSELVANGKFAVKPIKGASSLAR